MNSVLCVRGETVTGVVNTSVLNVRTGPGTNYTIAGKLVMGTEVTILEETDNGWYKIAYSVNDTGYEGYVSKSYITLQGDEAVEEDTDADDTVVDFETELEKQGFPESYKVYLRSLHEKYPNWKFVAVHTELDWETVVANETNVQGSIKNTVQGTWSAPHYNWRSTDVGYNWATDTWSVYDGTNWYAASKDLIEYYMDPRNCLDEHYIFEFESLNYVANGQSKAGVEALLAGSFMSYAKPKNSNDTYAEIMMRAGSSSGVSPYHIASRIKQEVGNTMGTTTSGENPQYPGIYNFYNIGAFDSASGDAAVLGLKWAAASGSYGRPWNSAEKSIVGGAGYIGSGYINKGQNTLYFEKFNVVNRTSGLYKHQYQTNIQAPTVEGYRIGKAYLTAGMKSSTITFNIPVYLNMPEKRCAKPADSGNPNHWLKSLKVSDYTLTPTFQVNANTEYELIVAETVTSITIQADTVNRYASISGTGTIPLKKGKNELEICVTAQNGDERIYTLTVVRGAEEVKEPEEDSDAEEDEEDTQEQDVPKDEENTEIFFEGQYRIENQICSGVEPGTDVEKFVKCLGACSGTEITVYQADGVTKETKKIGTGSIIVVKKGSQTVKLTVLIYGDVNGDGNITALDLLKLQKHILGSAKLDGMSLAAANIKRSGVEATALDLLKLQKHLIGATTISQ